MFSLLIGIIFVTIILEGGALIQEGNKSNENYLILRRIFLWQILSPVVIVALAILGRVFGLIFPPAAPELSIGLIVVFGPPLLLIEEILLSCVGLPLALSLFYTGFRSSQK